MNFRRVFAILKSSGKPVTGTKTHCSAVATCSIGTGVPKVMGLSTTTCSGAKSHKDLGEMNLESRDLFDTAGLKAIPAD